MKKKCSKKVNIFKFYRAKLAEKIDRYPRYYNLYKAIKTFCSPVQPTKLDNYSSDLKALPSFRRSKFSEPRINLLVPTINQEMAFGGINTVLDFWREISSYYKNIRIISFGDYSSTTIVNYSNYEFLSLKEDSNSPKQIISLLKKYGDSLPIGPQDIFIATYWKTAYFAERLVLWQSQEFSQSVKLIIYLIQDYEAGFYSWSSQYVLAKITYECQNAIAIFNTKLLQDYFHLQNHQFKYEYSFEPTLNQVLYDNFVKLKNANKKKQILIYGRPSSARNAFSIIVDSLLIWQENFLDANNWEILSVGQDHPDIPLNDNLVIKSLGKLSLEDYACVLAESAIGISLMISPHPSYPPLEMAHYGMWVITNNFANKNLTSAHDNIISLPLDIMFPENIAQNLSLLCDRVKENPNNGWSGKSYLNNYLSTKSLFPFVREIVEIFGKNTPS
jgi:hypothetical protein